MTQIEEKPRAARETLADVFVVDADVHIHEDPAGLAEYADPPWDVGLREIAKVEERYLDLPGMTPRAEFRVPFPGGSNRRQIVTSAVELRASLDDLRVNKAVLFPDHLLYLAMVRDPDFAATLARSYNQWLLEHWLREDPTLRGALVVAPQDPEAGAADIRRHAGRREFVCVYLPASGVRPLYGHRQYDVVYEAALEAGLPIALHSVEAVFPVFPFELNEFRTTLGAHAVAHPFSMIANMVSMLETGVPARYPELKLGFMEAGCGWIPFILHRLDKEYIERRREVPFLQERPSHYIKRCFFGTQPIEEPERLSDIVKLYELFDALDPTRLDPTAGTRRCSPPTGRTTTSTTPGTSSASRSARRRGARSWAATQCASSGRRSHDEGAHALPPSRAAGGNPSRLPCRQARARRLQHPRRAACAAQPLPPPARPAVRGQRLRCARPRPAHRLEARVDLGR